MDNVLIHQIFLPGQACQQNSDCATKVCTNSVCVGSTSGQACASSKDCYDGFYCNVNNICVAQSLLNGPCVYNVNDNGTNCQFGLVCSTTNTCVNLFSKAIGSSCVQSEECDVGLACFNNQCANPAPVLPCLNSSNCQGDPRYLGECSCNPFSQVVECDTDDVANLPTGCTNTLETLISCVQKNNCGNTLDCCTAELDCYYNCVYTQEGLDSIVCGGIPTCTSSTSSSGVSGNTGSTGSTGSSTTHSNGVMIIVSMYMLTFALVALWLIN